ncbi:hypothetical protein ACFYP9_25385 [Streptomyces goshikiensis]|uniref:ATP-binding protein n=1 Tax=Streptomyces goshikiensis TaxID=1942 RepID=UPI0036838677
MHRVDRDTLIQTITTSTRNLRLRAVVQAGWADLAADTDDVIKGGGTSTDTGYGLIGMRERAALLHGDFTAGPRPGGGFLVAARLPIPAGTGAEAKAGAR